MKGFDDCPCCHALEAENERLRAALWPLGQVHDSSVHTVDLLLGAGTVERAKAALGGHQQSPQEIPEQ